MIPIIRSQSIGSGVTLCFKTFEQRIATPPLPIDRRGNWLKSLSAVAKLVYREFMLLSKCKSSLNNQCSDTPQISTLLISKALLKYDTEDAIPVAFQVKSFKEKDIKQNLSVGTILSYTFGYMLQTGYNYQCMY